MKNTIKIDFDEFVTTFNEKGKNEAINLANDKYDLSFEQVKRRMVKITDYYFDTSLRIYRRKQQGSGAVAEFMTIDDLNMRKHSDIDDKLVVPLPGPILDFSFDELIKELIKDRILELSKYVTLKREAKKLVINKNRLKRDGFELIEF